MTLPATTSSSLSLSQIQTEFGGSNPIGLNEYYAGGSYVGSGTSGTYGAVPSSGAIDLYHFYGTSAGFTFNQTISGATYDYNLHNAAISAGWNGSLRVIATITVNAPIGSSSTGSYGFNTGTFPSGSIITIVNNSYIEGAGGAHGGWPYPYWAHPGGPALLLNYPVSINNGSGYIFGGGGGGAAAVMCQWGGGGGAGYAFSSNDPVNNDGQSLSTQATYTDGGRGNGGDACSVGGCGGTLGVAGGTGWSGGDSGGSGGGGGGGAAGGGQGCNAWPGGAAGLAINKQGYTLTWISGSGRVYGSQI